MNNDRPGFTDGATLTALRRFLLIVLFASVVGTLLELVLLGHTEDTWQFVPIVLLGLAIPIIAWHWLSQSRASLRALQAAMLLFVASGGLGVILHYKGNVEWELEGDAGMSGIELFVEAMMGAVPSLAPGTMALLGAVGLAYAFRHPALALTGRNT